MPTPISAPASATTCTRCPRRSAPRSEPRRCSLRGTPRSTSRRSKTSGWRRSCATRATSMRRAMCCSGTAAFGSRTSPMSSPATASPRSVRQIANDEEQAIAALAQAASVEMTWHDSVHLGACRELLPTGSLMYVSHIPGQTWAQTVSTCAAVRAVGLEPVPHLPARELSSDAALQHLLAELAARANIKQALVIAGDRAEPLGPFSQTLDVL